MPVCSVPHEGTEPDRVGRRRAAPCYTFPRRPAHPFGANGRRDGDAGPRAAARSAPHAHRAARTAAPAGHPGPPVSNRDTRHAREVTDSLAEVKVQESESIESALRRFKRKVQQEDIIKDIKKHSFYLKPGDKRRAKQALARKRTRKKQRRETE